MSELSFIERLRSIATHPAARGLMDDAAVLDIAGRKIVLTHDSICEGSHFLPKDPPQSVAWKLLAVNLSDLAAKGARPLAAMLSYTLTGNDDWDAAFLEGLAEVTTHFGVPLVGGDTISGPLRILGMTLIGEADGPVPDRRGAHVGDALYVTDTIGDAALGLSLAKAGQQLDGPLVAAYQRPHPQQEAGILLATRVSAMMDVSDGLLFDAKRLADASGVGLRIDLDAVPLSKAARVFGEDRVARMAAATGGDDYQLLFASALPLPPLPCQVSRIGQVVRGSGLVVHDGAGQVPLPDRLGWEHG